MSYRLLRDSWPVARRAHRCIWCGQLIQLGERYRNEHSIYDGQMQNHHWHRECDGEASVIFSGGEEEFTPYANERPVKP